MDIPAAPLDPEACYRALKARDPRFDGRFFTCVLTTGIYCRPVCPARTPKRENVRFAESAAAAEAHSRHRHQPIPTPLWDKNYPLWELPFVVPLGPSRAVHGKKSHQQTTGTTRAFPKCSPVADM